METEGRLRPESAAAARAEYETLVPAAKVATREATRAMGFDREEYRERVTRDVIESVRDALFASLLAVHVADQETFDEWLAERDREVIVTGSDHADRVVWHDPAFDDRVIAATFVDEREAAVGTLRRQAFGRVYRPILDAPNTTDANETSDDEVDANETSDDEVGENETSDDEVGENGES